MRLKGTFKDASSFTRIIQAISRMSNQCILRFGEDEISIVITKGMDAVETWASLTHLGSFFSSYRVESNNNNQVNLEVSTDALLQVLRSACATGAETVMKLAKRDRDPVLCLEVKMNLGTSQESYVVHQIPIRIKKAKEMENVKTAEESTAGQQANAVSRFPAIAEARSVAERMKTLDPNKVVIAVSRHGELKLIMSNDTIKVETIWKDLQHPDFLEEAANRPDAPTRFKSVRVDLKSFVKLMSCQLPEHDIELWLYQRVCATFVFHIKCPVQPKDVEYAAHIMVHLPSLSSD